MLTKKKLGELKKDLEELRLLPTPDVSMLDLITTIEKMQETLLELKHNNHHTIAEELWRIESALLPEEETNE